MTAAAGGGRGHGKRLRIHDRAAATRERLGKIDAIEPKRHCAGKPVALAATERRQCRRLIQAQEGVVDSKSLWDDYTYYSGEAKGMPEHFQHVATKIIETYHPSTGSLVIDIGSNDGSLLRPFKNVGYRVLCIDPAPEIVQIASA